MLLLVPLTLALAPAAADPVSAVRVGEHFRVVCHFRADALADRALEVAEAVWPVAVELYGADPAPLGQPLELHLYRDPEAYVQAEAAITGGYFRRNLAFAHHETCTAHVALQPQVDDRLLGRIGFPDQTLRLVAHEAAHLARFQTWPNHAFHPFWYVDGAASWVDQEVMEALELSAGLESDPWTSHELFTLQRMLAEERLPSAEAIFRDRLGRVSFYDRYAVRHLFFRFLRESSFGATLRDIQDEIQYTRPERRYLARIDAAIDAHFGAPGYRELDAAFHAYLRAARPEWQQVYRSLSWRDDAWLQIAFEDHDAVAWRTGAVGRSRYALRGSLEFLPGGRPQMNLLLAGGEAGHLALAFTSEHGITLFELAASGPAAALASASHPALDGHGQIPFTVVVADGVLTVSLAGEPALEVDLGQRDLTGRWGIGVAAGGAGRWRGLKLEAD